MRPIITCFCLVLGLFLLGPHLVAPAGAYTYPVVDTNQTKCYNNTVEITPPAAGQPFYGQDAQYQGIQISYTLSGDGLTVDDNNTGLTWQRSPDINNDGVIDADDKLTYEEAVARPTYLNTINFGGYSDWRLPSIKELFSLFLNSGTDPSGYTGTDTSVLIPFIDTDYFDFAYGDTSAGERIIDSQWASSNLFVADSNKLFGVNFADGRIKGYDLVEGTYVKTFFVICIRGNTDYALNNLVDNGDGTISDQATGLMWAQADSGTGMNWKTSLAWVQTQNAANYLGYSDWRLPNVKELQSIVDYSRSPETSGSAAIDPLFNCTQIINEAGETDYPYYWTGSTHVDWNDGGDTGAYVAFGRALGYMNGAWIDIHGAGAQRTDFKAGDPADYPFGHGPQGDAVRIYNYVRLVRGTSTQSRGALSAINLLLLSD